MKKLFYVITIIFSFILVGCIDCTQYITLDNNDNIHSIMIFELEKSMIDKINDMLGGSLINYSEILSELESSALENYPRNFKISKIINSQKIGLCIGGLINSRYALDNTLIPIRNGNKFVYKIYDTTTGIYDIYEMIDNAKDLGELLKDLYDTSIDELSKDDRKFYYGLINIIENIDEIKSMTIRLIISKKYIPSISKVYLYSSYSYNKRNISFFDLKDSFMFEIPIIHNMDTFIIEL